MTKLGLLCSCRSWRHTAATERDQMLRRNSQVPKRRDHPTAGTAERLAQAAEAAVTGDCDAALAIWGALAHAGICRAQAEIGRCFVSGLGVERNIDLAHKWLMLAAKAGDPLGQRLLGDFYFNGEDGAPDRAIAEEWYARAAKQGEGYAQDMLSWILIDGDHRKPDYKKAHEWALKAAAQGIAASMTRLGLLYHNALGVERDANLAAQWWLNAAILGDADGQAMLGAAYHLGAGVPREPVIALAWLTRARGARSKFADRFYNAVRDSCTPEQRCEAEHRASLPLVDDGAAP
jgi:TPR repeat protein